MSKLIVLDRDGVINADSPEFVTSPEALEPLPGSLRAISALPQAGYRVVVASNQSGLARGHLDPAALNAINARLAREVAEQGGLIEAFFFCPHHPDEGCDCRKPRDGLLREISRRLHLPLEGAPVVGDSLRDLEAARSCGARPVLVLTGNGRQTQAQCADWPELEVHEDLAAFTAHLLGRG